MPISNNVRWILQGHKNNTYNLTVIRLGFLRVVFSGEDGRGGGQFDPFPHILRTTNLI